MDDDLVKRLRDHTCDCFNGNTKHLTWQAADRIEQLEAALREICEVYAGSEGIPQPISASEGYLLHLIKNMVAISRAALTGEKKDDSSS